MVRIRMRRAEWVGVAIAGLMIVGLIWFAWVPSIVTRRVEEKLRSRGFSAEVDGASVGFGSVALSGLRARSVKPGIVLEASEIDVDASPWELGDGSSAVRGLEIHGLKLKIDLDAIATRELLAERGAKKGAPSASSARQIPALKIVGGEVTIADRTGTLIEARGLQSEVGDGKWTIRGESVRVGATPGEVIVLQQARAEGLLDGRRPVLVGAKAESTRLQWADEVDGANTDDALPAARGRTLARLRAAVQTLRGAPRAVGEDSANKRQLWAPQAKATLSRVRVVRGAGQQEEKLADFSLVLSAEGSDALRVQLSGRAADAGEIALDVKAWPRAARIEGRVNVDDVSLSLFAPALPPLPFHQLDRTRVRAELTLKGQGLEAIAATGEVAIRDLAFASEGLARLPVGPISLLMRGDGTWTPARRELQIAHADLEIGQLLASAAGVLSWPAGSYRVDSKVELKRSGCQRVLDAVPVGLLDELSGVGLEGDFSAKLAVHVDSSELDATKVDFDVRDGCKFREVPPVLDLTRFMQPFMHRVLEPEGEIFEFETGPGSPAWTPIELISPFMLQATVAHEDGRFFTHQGFAEPEIAVALSRNLKARAFKFGASTITMQLVKNVFLHRDKLLSRKVQEAFITWWLEQQWDKRRILELYLNVIEYGPGLYGIRNAAWHYFGTIPMNLTPAQSAFLASILPSPKSMHSHYDVGTLSASMKSRLASFLKHMRARDRIDDEALAFGLEELESFRFYRPDQPPPPAPLIRGTAKSPPFDVPMNAVDAWDSYDAPTDLPQEDGSFGP